MLAFDNKFLVEFACSVSVFNPTSVQKDIVQSSQLPNESNFES